MTISMIGPDEPRNLKPDWPGIRLQMEWYAIKNGYSPQELHEEYLELKKAYRDKGADTLISRGWVEEVFWKVGNTMNKRRKR